MKDLYETSGNEEIFSMDYEDVLLRLQKLDEKLHKLKKRKKGTKRGKKRKLKKRIKVLELEYEQLKQFVIFFAYQYKQNPQSCWQSVLCNTLPRALELATATINRLPIKTQPPYLTDGSDRK